MTYTTPITAWTAVDPVSSADFNSEIKGNIEHLHDNLPTRWEALYMLSNPTVVAGNALARTLDANQVLGFFCEQSAAANADSFTFTLCLGAGTYTLYVVGKTVTNGGLVDWDLSGVTITTGQNWYAAVAAFNTTQTIASIVITEANAGRQVLTATVNGKSGASSGYRVPLTWLMMKQATDS